MPYIVQDERDFLDPQIDRLLQDLPTNPGDMNYIITRLMIKFVEWHGGNYQAYNSAVGVLECCKLEFYRRQVADYEDICIKKNGDLQ